MKKILKLKIIIPLISIVLILFSSNIFAIENLDQYDPNPSLNGSESFVQKAGPVLGAIRIIGIITAVIVLAIIGLKYMFMSIQEKADYKKEMIPYIVGCFMLMGVSFLVGLIEQLNL